MQYDLILEHIDGERNRVADCLSRIAEDLAVSELEDVPEAEDIAEFPVTLYASKNLCDSELDLSYSTDYDSELEKTINSHLLNFALAVLDDYRYSLKQLKID